jgi:ribonuclease BN (tRNA processing enzyme)
MRLQFIGSGSAFTVGADNYQSNMILETDEKKKLLIDCGSDAKNALFDLGISFKDLEGVYVSHLHADHVGGLEWLSFATYFEPECKKPHLYVPEALVYDLWENVLSGGLKSIENKEVYLSTFFKIEKIKNNKGFFWRDIHFKILQTMHVMSEQTIIPSYGLFFEIDGIKIFLTTDTQFCPHQIKDFYNAADIIFHDCETANWFSGVHAHYKELITLSPEIKKKMWLYHYNPGPLPDSKSDGFRGFVKRGQTFDFANPATL